MSAGREHGRREVLVGLGGLLAAAVLAACGGGGAGDGGTRTPSGTGSARPAPSATGPGGGTTTGASGGTTATGGEGGVPAPTGGPSPTSSSLPDLEVMVGQMILLGFRGTRLEPSNPVLGDLRDRHLGGVVLFSRDVPSDSPTRNVTSPDQVAALCAALQAEADGPLLVATDQEGGRVARLGPDHGFPASPSAAELGAGDAAATRASARRTAATLRRAGVNLNLAPVVDLDVNPDSPAIGALDRAFSADPAVVAEHAAAFVDGHHDEGVLTCLKHFPGHGSARTDSHLGFTDVTDTWSARELEPYRTLVRGGRADAVMVAHVFNAHLDPDHPASLSAPTIAGLLRGELGFDGVVVSDDLQMRAVTQGWGMEEAIRLAVGAGTDLLTFSNNIDHFTPDLGARVHAAVMGLVASGEIHEARIAESYARIRRLKARL